MKQIEMEYSLEFNINKDLTLNFLDGIKRKREKKNEHKVQFARFYPIFLCFFFLKMLSYKTLTI